MEQYLALLICIARDGAQVGDMGSQGVQVRNALLRVLQVGMDIWVWAQQNAVGHAQLGAMGNWF
jgi:hypothetical protein